MYLTPFRRMSPPAPSTDLAFRSELGDLFDRFFSNKLVFLIHTNMVYSPGIRRMIRRFAHGPRLACVSNPVHAFKNVGQPIKGESRMADKQQSDPLKKGWMITVLIWAAMLASLGIYLGIAPFIRQTLETPLVDPNVLEQMRLILFGIGVFTLISMGFIRKLLLKKAPGQRRSVDFGGPELARYTTAMMITLALAESIGIYGFILYLIGSDVTDLFAFIGAAALAMLYYRPKKAEVEKLAGGFS